MLETPRGFTEHLESLAADFYAQHSYDKPPADYMGQTKGTPNDDEADAEEDSAKPADTEQRRLAYIRWENFALRRLDRGLPLDEEFDTRYLDADEREEIRAELRTAGSVEEVKAVFVRAREMGLPQFAESYQEMQRREIARRWRERRLAAEREG
jgi:hypothetical protein